VTFGEPLSRRPRTQWRISDVPWSDRKCATLSLAAAPSKSQHSSSEIETECQNYPRRKAKLATTALIERKGRRHHIIGSNKILDQGAEIDGRLV
jgi:hypothetical protein